MLWIVFFFQGLNNFSLFKHIILRNKFPSSYNFREQWDCEMCVQNQETVAGVIKCCCLTHFVRLIYNNRLHMSPQVISYNVKETNVVHESSVKESATYIYVSQSFFKYLLHQPIVSPFTKSVIMKNIARKRGYWELPLLHKNNNYILL